MKTLVDWYNSIKLVFVKILKQDNALSGGWIVKKKKKFKRSINRNLIFLSVSEIVVKKMIIKKKKFISPDGYL